MRTTLVLGIALLTLSACGRGEPTAPPAAPTPASVSGSYTLQTLDGQALPFNVVEIGAYQAKLVSGTLVLNPDGTYALEFGLQLDVTGNPRPGTASDQGRWSLDGATVMMVSSHRDVSRTGVVSGNVITLQSSIRTLVLRK